MKKVINKIKVVLSHFKRNAGNYVVVAILGYLIYQLYQMLSDTGVNKDGNVYYNDFEEEVINE